MKIFTKQQAIVVCLTLLILAVVSFFNFKIALRRSRDAQRKDDIANVVNGLEKFKSDFAYYPLSTSDGRINACNGGCIWGKDPLRDMNDLTYPPYINMLPGDPDTGKGVSYIYVSNGYHYQLYAALEGRKDEDEYNSKIEARHIMCGMAVCNFGRSSSQTPLDKSIEEYENELRAKSKKK